MRIGDPFTEPTPAVSAAGPAYAAQVNEILDEAKTRLSSRVPVSALEAVGVDTLNLDNHALTLASYVAFQDQGVAPAGAPYSRLEFYNGELHVVTAAGVVQLTAGGLINAAGIGGIGGDYGSGDELVTYSVAPRRYDFFSDKFANEYGHVQCETLIVTDTSGTSRTITLDSPALAANRVYTLPPAPPTLNRSLLQMDANGDMTANDASNQVTNPVYVNNDIVLGGAFKVKHGSRQMVLSGFEIRGPRWNNDVLSAHIVSYSGPSAGVTNLGLIPIPLPVGSKITSLSFSTGYDISGPGTRTYALVSNGAVVASTSVTTATSIAFAPNHTMTSTTWIAVTPAQPGDYVIGVTVTWVQE